MNFVSFVDEMCQETNVEPGSEGESQSTIRIIGEEDVSETFLVVKVLRQLFSNVVFYWDKLFATLNRFLLG